MLLAGLDLLFDTALNLYIVISRITTQSGIQPWKGWEDTHSNFSRVQEIPSLFWRSSPILQFDIELTRWIPVFCAISFFAFFGFADEAMKNYRSAVLTITKKIGVSTVGSGTIGFFSSTMYVSL